MWIVDIELYGMEEVRYLVGRGYLPIDKVFTLAPDGYLPRDGDFGTVVVSDGGAG